MKNSDSPTFKPKVNKKVQKAKRRNKYIKERQRDLEAALYGLSYSLTSKPRSEVRRALERNKLELADKDFEELVSNWSRVKEYCNCKEGYTVGQRIQFWNKLAKSKFPMFVKKTSDIHDAGHGVFVSHWYPYCPAGAFLVFNGRLSTDPPNDEDSIHISDELKLELVSDEYPVVCILATSSTIMDRSVLNPTGTGLVPGPLLKI